MRSGVRNQIAVPFVDLARVHSELRDAVLADVGDLIDRSEFGLGPTVEAFERELAHYCGRREAIGVSSGLDALRFALAAAGVQAGDGVVVPANTFVATFAAVSQLGAVPVPADVSLDDYNLDPAAAAAGLEQGGRVLLPVHLYGQLADMRTLAAVAAQHDAVIVEDAAQAHGASRDGVRPGDRSAAAAFSFYPGKNLGAMGDAGAVVTDDAELAGTLRMLREHGQRAKYAHELVGWTGRLDAFQAAVLRRKLRLLDDWNAQRREVAGAYDELLAGVGDLTLPPAPAGSTPVWHLYAVRTRDPARLADGLARRGIGTGRHYPEPPHLSRAFAHLGYGRGAFPVAERLAAELLSLPIFAGMTIAEAEAVAAAVADVFARG